MGKMKNVTEAETSGFMHTRNLQIAMVKRERGRY